MENKYKPNDEVEMYIRNLETPKSKIRKVNVKGVTLKNTPDIVKDFINYSQKEYRNLNKCLI